MPELIVIVIGAAAAFLLWKGLTARSDQPDFIVAGSTFGSVSAQAPLDMHQWPHLGLFEFEVDQTLLYQAALRSVLEQQGPHCVATLSAGDGSGLNTGAPVEVLVEDERVGFLFDGDATRFHRRLAYEARPGQLSQCDARITVTEPVRKGEKRVYGIVLDLKPFRH